MRNDRLIYLNLFFLSASILCFEVIATRISSVIFVDNYAFIIISLALLGLATGSVFSYYRISTREGGSLSKIASRSSFLLGVTLCLFIILVIGIPITDPFSYFFLLFLPFFFAGIVYAQLYKIYSERSFKLYASDLAGAAAGSVASLGVLSMFGGPNSVLLLVLILLALSVAFMHKRLSKKRVLFSWATLLLLAVALILNGKNEFLGRVPIGDYPEKDFYHVYPDPSISSKIIDSRWSIYGRSDLVQYTHQDMVRQLFVDGAAGTQVYRFNGNVQNTQSILQELLLHNTTAIPFLCLKKEEKRSMLVIGPGGGKEVLLGLFGEIEKITAVEVNPDFVKIVKDHKGFDGGIYSDFSNVMIIVEEGRHYVKQSNDVFDLIVMALPSTEQMQNIEPFATNENYLLTKEAVEDYLKKLSSEGRLIFAVHNEWELLRLITTAVSVFQDMGVTEDETKNHFVVFEAEYAPAVVIKKNTFTLDETLRWKRTCETLPRDLPTVTYLPYGMSDSNRSTINQFLTGVSQSPDRVKRYISQSEYDISPCMDDKPYFYKKYAGIPDEYLWLLAGIVGINFLVVWLPLRFIRRNTADNSLPRVTFPLAIFICIGIGFMILEVSLFQKLVLYLGSPTISLSILLSSLLVGMGAGSYFGRNVFGADVRKRLYVVSMAIVVVGIVLFAVSPAFLTKILEFELPLRAAISFLVILPLAFLLGIPFPSSVQLLTLGDNDRYIPWMYGVNGSMSVLGSVLAAILCMLFGFTPTYFLGLFFYLGIFLISFSSLKKGNPGSVVA
jgi:spermidine synthase/MFS family permease